MPEDDQVITIGYIKLVAALVAQAVVVALFFFGIKADVQSNVKDINSLDTRLVNIGEVVAGRTEAMYSITTIKESIKKIETEMKETNSRLNSMAEQLTLLKAQLNKLQ
jgi:prefoldin subunit 5